MLSLAEQAAGMFVEREQRIAAVERQGGALIELTGRSTFDVAGGRIVRIVDRS